MNHEDRRDAIVEQFEREYEQENGTACRTVAEGWAVFLAAHPDLRKEFVVAAGEAALKMVPAREQKKLRDANDADGPAEDLGPQLILPNVLSPPRSPSVETAPNVWVTADDASPDQHGASCRAVGERKQRGAVYQFNKAREWEKARAAINTLLPGGSALSLRELRKRARGL